MSAVEGYERMVFRGSLEHIRKAFTGFLEPGKSGIGD
ncbi:MAG: hypothetical protein RLZZ09_1040 [Pseudomonadota bacterium]|jgi:hypothetical protein